MENILDHEEKKNTKQVFAKLTLLFALLSIGSIAGMMYLLYLDIGMGGNLSGAAIFFALAYVLFGILSFVFSFITIFQKESWTLIKVFGVGLSGLLFLLFAAGLFVSFLGFA